MRIVETLAKDLKSRDIWQIPEDITLAWTVQKQNDKSFRKQYLIGNKPLKCKNRP